MKPGVFTQLYVQIVFAVEEWACFLRNKAHNEEIFKYISGIVTKPSAIVSQLPVASEKQKYFFCFLRAQE